MIIQNFEQGIIGNNNYVLIDSNEACLIDCTVCNSDIMEFITSHGAKLKFILLTHGHFDHILGLAEWQEQYHTPAYVHEADYSEVQNCNTTLKMFGMRPIKVPTIDKTFKDGDTFQVGNIILKTYHTPGHTPGSVCFSTESILFSGDTLFCMGRGRTDLPGGNEAELSASIQKLFKLFEDKTIVYPGHGKTTTIANEKGFF